MTEQPSPSAESLSRLEAAIRHSAARVMKPTMPPALALGFFLVTIRLARCLRQCRKTAGLPRVWAPEMVAVLRAIEANAEARMNDPASADDQSLRLLSAIAGLSMSIDMVVRAPEKVKKAPSKKAPQPVAASMPRRRDDYAGVGVIAVRALNAATSADAMMADMVRRAMGSQPTAGTTVIHNRM
jgi:hypothetical protein